MNDIDKSWISSEILDKSPMDVIRERINSQDQDNDPFYVCNLQKVVERFKFWTTMLPRVTPFYAVKCNDDPILLKCLAQLGTGFDCASKNEIQKILGLGVSPQRIVYANPCKQPSHVRYAKEHQVYLTVFDGESELHKIKSIYPAAKLMLRIQPPKSDYVLIDLREKYGANLQEAKYLLQVAKQLDLHIVGVSFHVGSACSDVSIFPATIEIARKVFDSATDLGFQMDHLDIGGGFLGNESDMVLSKQVFESVQTGLKYYFPDALGVTLIAEPGRFMVSSAYTLVVNIIGKRKKVNESQESNNGVHFNSYVNDGLYGNFKTVLIENDIVEPSLLHAEKYENKPRYISTIWGQTCSSTDFIRKECFLPELSNGDWIAFENKGAYSISLQTPFNNMPVPRRLYTMSS